MVKEGPGPERTGTGQSIITAAEYRRIAGKTPKKPTDPSGKTRNKFGSQRLETDDGAFDSKGEYRRFLNLQMLERIGEIKNLKRQVRIPLIVNEKALSITDKLGRERRLSYVADFTYDTADGHIIEDFKGFDTPVSRLKRAIVEAMLGVTVTVTRR